MNGLRPLAAEDLAFVQALLRDPDVRRYLGGPVPERETEHRFSAYLSGLTWLCHTEEQPAGLLFIGPYKGGSETELSYMFARQAWGRGLATQACQQLIASLGAPPLVAETQAENAASRRLLDRLGFHFDQHVMRFGARQAVFRRS